MENDNCFLSGLNNFLLMNNALKYLILFVNDELKHYTSTANCLIKYFFILDSGKTGKKCYFYNVSNLMIKCFKFVFSWLYIM